MKHTITYLSLLILLTCSFTFGSIAVEKNRLKVAPQAETKMANTYSELQSQTDGNFEGGLIWRETFETPASWTKWTSKDNTYPRPVQGPGEWIINDWEAYEGSAWRCANLAFGDHGGYDNHWYQVLDTPPLLLDEDATFTFYHRYAVEGAAGATDPYDAWDGLNVRISTDGGESWIVLPSTTYNATSIWAFGHPDQGHNEGPGIAGWAGEMHTWTQESFDLSAYTSAENSIILRFALASDMAYSTADGAPALYSWQVDNIEVKSATKTFLTNYGVNEDLVGKSNEFIPPLGEDLWHIVKITEPLPPLKPEFKPFGLGFNHAMSCQNSGVVFDPEATYNPYMDNIVYTGPISIPESSPVYLDYKYIPFFIDLDDFPNVEFFRPEVSTDGENWEYIETDPYVYALGFDQWLEFAWTYGYPVNASMFDLSRFVGQDIYLSFRFWSDYDQPYGYGLLVDDIVIYSPTRFIPAPENLVAEANIELEQIDLSWDEQHLLAINTVYRRLQGGSKFTAIAEVMGQNSYSDADALPYYTYDYMTTTTVKYMGTSAPSDTVSAGIIPMGVVELAYDDGESDSSVAAAANKQISVKFTPNTYPIAFEALKIMLDKSGTTGTAAQFAVYDDDGTDGAPGTRLARMNKSGLVNGYNVLIFSSPVTITEGSFYLAYKRYGNGLKVCVDTDAPIDGNTYIETNSGWEQQTGYDAIIHAFIDTTVTGKTGQTDYVSGIFDQDNMNNPNEFKLFKNYPNPFNPSTTISFNVPSSAVNQKISLEIFDLLGRNITTLYSGNAQAGLNKIQWMGQNNAGNLVNSGIYIVRFKTSEAVLTQRILLMK